MLVAPFLDKCNFTSSLRSVSRRDANPRAHGFWHTNLAAVESTVGVYEFFIGLGVLRTYKTATVMLKSRQVHSAGEITMPAMPRGGSAGAAVVHAGGEAAPSGRV